MIKGDSVTNMIKGDSVTNKTKLELIFTSFQSYKRHALNVEPIDVFGLN